MVGTPDDSVYSCIARRHYLKLSGDRLRQNLLVVPDAGGPGSRRTRVELSDKVFPRQFPDGASVTFQVEDHSICMRYITDVLFRGYSGDVFYTGQEPAVVIRLGNEEQSRTTRRYMRGLREILPQDTGRFLVTIEGMVPE